MITITGIIILVVVLGGITALFLGYRIALYFINKRNETSPQSSTEVRKASFSISGNLVVESNGFILENYRLTKTLLGRGASAEVFVGENIHNNHRYAVKIIDLSRKDILWRYDREKNFLKDIEHSNVVRLFEVYSTPKQMFFVTELCTGGHLGHLLKRTEGGHLPELVARKLILQITRALAHCHDHGICHRDIKLQNILLDNHSEEAQIKIIDFGNAVRFRGCLPLKKVVGTTYTAAPEVFRQNYDERCDVWSLGVVAYILLCGRRPFEKLIGGSEKKNNPNGIGSPIPILRQQSNHITNNINNPSNIQQVLPALYRNSSDAMVIASILLGRFHFHHEPFKSVSREAIYFIKTCLEVDYTDRVYIKDLLANSWLKNDFLLQATTGSWRKETTIGKESFSSPSPRSLSSRRNSRPTVVLPATITAASPISPPPFIIAPPHSSSSPNHQRQLLTVPVLSPNDSQILLEAASRLLKTVGLAGMRNLSMLAVAFSMPIMKVRKLRDLFQEMDRNGNGLIGEWIFCCFFFIFPMIL
jgi:serine/threonine protein kinase